ncbi:hypothetical protein M9H77_11189 [Catharanthus roseus]|uniref:Uncharacterized protein n=1 Tax=Catharanthus roseus TaxID=4058 RepID=A0ACC0BDX1_CATRO|nr:hypothetical protein M9H77_11189 [Catharanthus roseus]
MLKKPNFPFPFKRLNKKSNNSSGGGSGGGDGSAGSNGGSGRWKFKNFSSGLRWKRKFTLHLWFIDGFLFKIVSVLEAIVLVSTLCVFFLCCGCHI